MLFISKVSKSEESLIEIKTRDAYGYYGRLGTYTYC